MRREPRNLRPLLSRFFSSLGRLEVTFFLRRLVHRFQLFLFLLLFISGFHEIVDHHKKHACSFPIIVHLLLVSLVTSCESLHYITFSSPILSNQTQDHLFKAFGLIAHLVKKRFRLFDCLLWQVIIDWYLLLLIDSVAGTHYDFCLLVSAWWEDDFTRFGSNQVSVRLSKFDHRYKRHEETL